MSLLPSRRYAHSCVNGAAAERSGSSASRARRPTCSDAWMPSASCPTRTSRPRSAWSFSQAPTSRSQARLRRGRSRPSTSSSSRDASSTSRSAAAPTNSSSLGQRPTSPPRALPERPFSRLSTTFPSRPATPPTRRSASFSSAGRRCRLPAGGEPTAHSSRLRLQEAVRRGTPVLVTHAGHMSRPILERLGFTPVARIDRLIDVF